MTAIDLIRHKRDGHAYSDEQIEAIVRAVTFDEWPDYQTSALLMAIFLRGLSQTETAALTRAMAHSGEVLSWDDVPGPKVDKHSTGGVGDKTTLVTVPLAAACGVIVPKLSGRGLGHSGGTVDKLESIPGFRTELTVVEKKAILRDIGAVLVGQSGSLAPADKKLYALRDVTATIESVPLIASSVLSKKLAENLDGLVLDVKCGSGAFMPTEERARELAQELTDVGNLSGLPTQVLITSMDAPLGRAVGNALEVIEAIDTLRGDGPLDLRELSVAVAAHMVHLARLADSISDAVKQVTHALDSGAGLEKFRQIVERQGGDPAIVDHPERLPTTPIREPIRATRDGYIVGVNALAIGTAAMRLGAGRVRKEDTIDPAVGIMMVAKPGDRVRMGDPIMEVHVRERASWESIRSRLEAAVDLSENDPTPTLPPLIRAN